MLTTTPHLIQAVKSDARRAGSSETHGISLRVALAAGALATLLSGCLTALSATAGPEVSYAPSRGFGLGVTAMGGASAAELGVGAGAGLVLSEDIHRAAPTGPCVEGLCPASANGEWSDSLFVGLGPSLSSYPSGGSSWSGLGALGLELNDRSDPSVGVAAMLGPVFEPGLSTNCGLPGTSQTGFTAQLVVGVRIEKREPVFFATPQVGVYSAQLSCPTIFSGGDLD